MSQQVVISCSNVHAQTDEPSPFHVIILGFDGWGSQSFQNADMPYLKEKLKMASWSIHKRSILPTSSACNWATMFKGIGPEGHGYIVWDTKEPAFSIVDSDEKGNFPSVFSLFRQRYPNYEMGYLYQWEGMKFIFDMADFNTVREFPVSPKGTDDMAVAAMRYIRDKKPALAAFIWDYPDRTGHIKGWYSPNYMEDLTTIDSIIKEIVKTCEKAGIMESTLIMITSDHGGHDKTHHEPLMSDLETPFIIFGKGVSPGEITSPVLQYDVAAILADYLRIKMPLSWRGRTPEEVFN